MPHIPRKACAKQGCKNYAERGNYCKEHAPTKPFEFKNYNEKDRPSSAKRGYGDKWRKYRKNYLRRHPLCAVCNQPANIVDHIEDHKGDMGKFWAKDNHQSLCSSCHNKKTWATQLSKNKHYRVTIDKTDKIGIKTTPITLIVNEKKA